MSELCIMCRKKVNKVTTLAIGGWKYVGPLCIPCLRIARKSVARTGRMIRRRAEQLRSAHIRS